MNTLKKTPVEPRGGEHRVHELTITNRHTGYLKFNGVKKCSVAFTDVFMIKVFKYYLVDVYVKFNRIVLM